MPVHNTDIAAIFDQIADYLEIEGENPSDISEYIDQDSEKYKQMVENIRKRLKLTTLKYQRLDLFRREGSQ